MDSIGNSLLSDHIGNLILQELYSLRSDVKQEIYDLGVKLARLIDLKNEEDLADEAAKDTSFNSEINSYLTTPQYVCDNVTDAITIVSSDHSLHCHHSHDRTPTDIGLPSSTFVEAHTNVPLLECDGLTETNLMTSPYDCVISDFERGSSSSGIPVVNTLTNCPSTKNYQCTTAHFETAGNAEAICIEVDNISAIGSEKATSSNAELSLSLKDDSNLLSLATKLPVPSVSILKYEDIDDSNFSNVNNSNVENEDVVSTDEEGSIKSTASRKSNKLKPIENNATKTNKSNLQKEIGRCPSKFLFEKHQKKITSKTRKRIKKDSSVLAKQMGHTKKQLVCNVCGKKFVHPRILSLHIKKSHGEQRVLCSVCKKPFANGECLKEHMKVHKNFSDDESGNSSDELLECSICNKVLFSNNMFNMHMRGHFKQTSFNCKYCSKMFFGLKKLHKHMNEHKPKATLVCKKCGKGFKNRKAYTLHSNRHVRAPHSCVVCNKAFVRESTLRLHMQSFHGFTTLECSYCAATFPDQKHLLAHLKCHSKKAIREKTSHSPYSLRKRSAS